MAGSTGGTVKIDSGTAGSTASETITYNDSVTITATVAAGYEFVGWYKTDGSLVTATNPYTFNMPYYSFTYRARFRAREYTVTFNGKVALGA